MEQAVLSDAELKRRELFKRLNGKGRIRLKELPRLPCRCIGELPPIELPKDWNILRIVHSY